MTAKPGRNLAVILSAGSGVRMGLDYPKQFHKVAGKTILEHTLDVFERSRDVDDILVVAAHDHVDQVLRLVAQNPSSKVVRVIAGGATRTQSTRLALGALGAYAGDAKVLFHDAVRPLVSQQILERCFRALDTAGAVDVVIPSADTIVRVDLEGCIADIPDRAAMMRGQTPQGFRLDVIRRAYEQLDRRPEVTATCDCSIVFKLLPEVRIATVLGDPGNIKITVPLDIHLAEKLFHIRDDYEQGLWPPPTREQAFGKVVVLFGGHSGIGLAMHVKAEALGARVHSFGRSATGTDVRRREDVESALAQVALMEGRVDLVVDSAGLLLRRPLAQMTDDECDALLDTNLRGALHIARAAYPHLARSRGGLMLFSSSSYSRGRAYYGIYSATKAAVVNLTQSLADEWSDAGIRVNCVSPDRTLTPMRVATFGEEPAHTLLTADEVADVSLAALFSVRTGQLVNVRLPEGGSKS